MPDLNQQLIKYIKPLGITAWLVLFMVPTSLYAAAEVRRSMSLEDKVAQLEKQLQTANRMRAETQFQITNLQNEIRNLRGIIEEQSYQIEQITNRQRDIYRNLDQVAAANTAQATPTISDQNQVGNDLVPPGNVDDPVPSQTQPIQVTEPTVTETDIRAKYDTIFPLVREKRYDDAIVRYQQFIAEHGDDPLVSNARYWLAQIYFVQGRRDEAEREYLLVAQQYPDSAKASDAWFKLGQLYEDRGQTDKAIESYDRAVTQYANTTAARLAQARLDAIRP